MEKAQISSSPDPIDPNRSRILQAFALLSRPPAIPDFHTFAECPQGLTQGSLDHSVRLGRNCRKLDVHAFAPQGEPHGGLASEHRSKHP